MRVRVGLRLGMPGSGLEQRVDVVKVTMHLNRLRTRPGVFRTAGQQLAADQGRGRDGGRGADGRQAPVGVRAAARGAAFGGAGEPAPCGGQPCPVGHRSVCAELTYAV